LIDAPWNSQRLNSKRFAVEEQSSQLGFAAMSANTNQKKENKEIVFLIVGHRLGPQVMRTSEGAQHA
jgi:hypothetical protein